MRRLEDKINGYLDFIRSGEIYEPVEGESTEPVAPGAPTGIRVMYMADPPKEAQWFYTRVAKLVEELGIAFSTERIQT